MSDITEQAKLKACELANAEQGEGLAFRPDYVGNENYPVITAFARYIQQVSDAAKEADRVASVNGFEPASVLRSTWRPFILPDPVDPLYEALFAVVELGRYDTKEQTDLLRHELAKRGLKIVKASQ